MLINEYKFIILTVVSVPTQLKDGWWRWRVTCVKKC